MFLKRLGGGLDLSATDDEDSDSLEATHRYGRPIIRPRRRSPSARSSTSHHSASAKYDSLYNDDTDSGISNHIRGRSTRNYDLSSSKSRGLSRSALSLNSSFRSRSRTGSVDRRSDVSQSSHQPSVHRSTLDSYRTRTSPRQNSALEDHYIHSLIIHSPSKSTLSDTSSLEESEMRRILLVDKLRDAKDTIHLQSTRLERAETAANDAAFELEDLKFREKDLQRKIYMLEKERSQNISMQMDALRARENMQCRVISLEEQLSMCRSQIKVLKEESEKKQSQLESLSAAAHTFDLEKQSMQMEKENILRELSAIREARDVTKARNEWLEENTKDKKGELERLRKENLDFGSENKLLNNKLIELKTTSMCKTEEFTNLQNVVMTLKEEKEAIIKEADQLKEKLNELRNTYTTTAAEKERYVREKVELSNRIQGLTSDRDSVHMLKASLEEQLAEYTGELNTTKAIVNQLRDDKKKIDEENEANKKVNEKLSTELSSLKSRLEKAHEQVSSLEKNKKLAFQQYNVYEQEIQSLEKQIEALKKSMGNVRSENAKDKEKLEEHIGKLKEELKKVKNERNQLEVKVHELETKLQHCERKLHDQTLLMEKERESWKSDCDKLNAILAKKDADLHSLRNQVMELDSQTSVLKVSQSSYQGHYEELNDAREELVKLREDNRKLAQEKSENQHVIQLLEMQKAILSKTSDGDSKERLQNQIDELLEERRELRKKVQILEAVKDELVRDKEAGLICEDIFIGPSTDKDHNDRLQTAENEAKKLNAQKTELDQKVRSLRKEYETYKYEHSDCVPVAEYKRLQNEKLKLEREVSDIVAKKLMSDQQYEALKSQVDHVCKAYGKGDVSNLSALVTAYEQEQKRMQSLVQQLQLQVQEAEISRQAAEDKNRHLQHSLNNSLHQLSDRAAEKNEDITKLRIQNKTLEAELQEAKTIQSKQTALINTLKEELDEEKTKKPSRIRQSLDEVGGELTSMRQELQKLLEVIQVKDAAIENLEEQLKVSRQQANACLEKGASEVDGTFPVADSGDLNSEKAKLLENMKRELKAKDRQIESLEEQLQSATRVEIKKLRRTPSTSRLDNE